MVVSSTRGESEGGRCREHGTSAGNGSARRGRRCAARGSGRSGTGAPRLRSSPRVSMTSPAKACTTAVGRTCASSVMWVQPSTPPTRSRSACRKPLQQVQADQPTVGVAEVVAAAGVGHPARVRAGLDDVEARVDDDAQQHVVDRLAGRPQVAGEVGVAGLDVGQGGVDLPQAIVAREDLNVDLASMLELARGRAARERHRGGNRDEKGLAEPCSR